MGITALASGVLRRLDPTRVVIGAIRWTAALSGSALRAAAQLHHDGNEILAELDI